jgi:hypothetical protein
VEVEVVVEMILLPLLPMELLEDLVAEVLHMVEHLEVEQELLDKEIPVVLDLQPQILLVGLVEAEVLVVLETLDLAQLGVLEGMEQHLLFLEHQ